MENKTAPWCPTEVDYLGRPYDDTYGYWGFCESEDPLDAGCVIRRIYYKEFF